ncbi:hypothetical protein TALK_14780 [Thalassospira alkalitolerans]|uniref:Uncharacterized protein n=2 Tax=Thalassospira alkalitolerans TaxID=1293890 RepID=A0A1Y2L9B5_9PROT|nr:hypothetical protein TALK_14780 [Thalassospira alkalitolerans]
MVFMLNPSPDSTARFFGASSQGEARVGDLVNLRQARKKKKRDAKERQADANRSLHGRTRGERTKKDAEDHKADKEHEGHFREDVDVEAPDAETVGSKSSEVEHPNADSSETENPTVPKPEVDQVKDAKPVTSKAVKPDASNVVSFFRAANPNSEPDND